MVNNFNAEQARNNIESGLYSYERMLREILANTETASRMRFRMTTTSYDDSLENREIITQVTEELQKRGFEVASIEVGERIFVEVSF